MPCPAGDERKGEHCHGIDCMATIACAGRKRVSAFITNLENPKMTPLTSPLPSAASSVSGTRIPSFIRHPPAP
jgi:hypothetical protein